ncbi:MAG TPA: heavy metal translocating P-type ATPase [Terriglobia bacterium]|nr:heavy metal translocating P-type ATPase [Terriglobia bacterium]
MSLTDSEPLHAEPTNRNDAGRKAKSGTGTNENRKIQKQGQRATHRKETYIAILAGAAIILHLLFRYSLKFPPLAWQFPLYITLAVGGAPLLWDLLKKVWQREFGSDLLAGISILTSVLLGEYLVGVIVVLMLSGGTALEHYATRRASSVLEALAKRMPRVAHRKDAKGVLDINVEDIAVGDSLVIFPHEVCPVDGVVAEGYGSMDEAYLTGEPFEISKAPGAQVISGAINNDALLTITATKLPVDSRYAKIMRVMEMSERNRPRLRRIGDQLGAWYTPAAIGIAGVSGLLSGSPNRFLAVVVIATPCPLLIAIPIVVIGAISLAARRGIVIKSPAALEQIDSCTTLIFDKTGTLTYGTPTVTEIICPAGFVREQVLGAAASLERYSKHPLAGAILAAAKKDGLPLQTVKTVSEKPGEGLRGTVDGHLIHITGRGKSTSALEDLPPAAGGLECLVFIDEVYAGLFRFRDTPRRESHLFIRHLKPRHQITRVVLLSGDRESEVRYLADSVGINEVHAGKSPEEKVAIVRKARQHEKTLFVGDGINDAPALLAATVGVAFGTHSDITSEAADAVILEQSLDKVDELMHIARRMRHIALESAVGGMALSIFGMLLAAAGLLAPISGAVGQEFIDLLAVLNALRMSLPPKGLTDF